jgi:uncharacterized FAD-dependent dehydrogenase
MASVAPTAELSLELGLDDPDDEAALRRLVARKLKRDEAGLPQLTVLRRSLDARRGSVRFQLLVGLGAPEEHALAAPDPGPVSAPRIAIVGDGPAGLFCAYELARRGIGSVVIDRGKPVQPRRHDLKGLNRHGRVDVDSNYCFGEGGAGTYSDGKLYTRAHKRGNVRDVLEILARHGAPPAILVEARPHIGSNLLPKVITALRERLEAAGVQFRFGSRVSALLIDGAPRRAVGVRLVDGSEIMADAVVLATGHSARDIFEMLAREGLPLEPKPFALGVRIEHPQPLVNLAQYGRSAGHPRLPNAAYRLACEVGGRGVFSFCMCPGGWIVPAATEPDGLVVNGMSLSRRDSPFANSGLVVAVEPADYQRAGHGGSLGGVEFQRAIERAAFQAGAGALRAPAVRASDFVRGGVSSSLPDSSYIPGLTAADLGAVLEAGGVPIAQRIRDALRVFDRKLRGYISDEAVLVGVETRTSAPVRVPRDPETLEAFGLSGLYPAGEGAGYAGGIVSAALDGMRIARALALAGQIEA